MCPIITVLLWENGVYTVINNSQSGIYINGKWMEEPQKLQYGDQIHMMGLKLVYLGEVLSIEARIGQIEEKNGSVWKH